MQQEIFNIQAQFCTGKQTQLQGFENHGLKYKEKIKFNIRGEKKSYANLSITKTNKSCIRTISIELEVSNMHSACQRWVKNKNGFRKILP